MSFLYSVARLVKIVKDEHLEQDCMPVWLNSGSWKLVGSGSLMPTGHLPLEVSLCKYN